MRVERTPSLLTLGVVSSTDGLQIDAIAVGALDNYFVCSTNFGLQTTNGFTLPGEIRLCATPHKGFDRSSRKPTEECLCQLDGRVGRHFRGRRGRCLADTDLTMVERLGAARNADS